MSQGVISYGYVSILSLFKCIRDLINKTEYRQKYNPFCKLWPENKILETKRHDKFAIFFDY